MITNSKLVVVEVSFSFATWRHYFSKLIFWHDVQNEVTVIFAKFGKDLFNISKVIGRKSDPGFFGLPCRSTTIIASLQ